MFVGGLFCDPFGRPFIGYRIAVAMKDLGRMIAQQRIDLVLSVPPVGVVEIGDILAEPYNRAAFVTCRRRLKQGVLVDREAMRLVFPKKHRARIGRLIRAPVDRAERTWPR